MSNGYTPGPWQHSQKLSGSENHQGFTIWNCDGWGLADVKPADQDGVEGESNARLIAAAPELLELLQHIRRCIPYGGFAQIHDGSATVADIDAAIAKATGETK